MNARISDWRAHLAIGAYLIFQVKWEECTKCLFEGSDSGGGGEGGRGGLGLIPAFTVIDPGGVAITAA